MQGTIIKELKKLPNLNSQLAEYLKKLIQAQATQSLSFSASKEIATILIQSSCQAHNLLHYKHLDQRTTSEKCLLLIQDLFNRLIADRPQLLQHIANEFISHILGHLTCFVSYAFFLMIARKHIVQLRSIVTYEKLQKVLSRVKTSFQEAGEIQYLKQMGQVELQQWSIARNELERYLEKKVKYNKIKKQSEQVNISSFKIPPLMLPSSKSIHSSRYSAISREERTKGMTQMRQLASAIGESFVAVELGCLLAHKRTQQVQQFFDNSDYRNKCFEKIQTDRVVSSRFSLFENSYNQSKSIQIDETNRRFYKKVLIIHSNLLQLFFQPEMNSQNYSVTHFKPFYLEFITISTVGIIDPWHYDSQAQISSSEYFTTINLELHPIRTILKQWGQRVSFITQKRHLKMLWNRNKKNGQFYYEEQLVQAEVNDQFQSDQVQVIRNQHIKTIQGTLKSVKKQEKYESDFILNQITHKFNQLFSRGDMTNVRFYKYETNLLALLASYLHNSFSNTVQYLAIDLLFPVLLLIKRQILQLSHPLLDRINLKSSLNNSKRFSKKNDTHKNLKIQQPLIVIYPELFCNFLLVISGLISNHKHVQKLISTIFIKNTFFMQTLQKYTKYLFEQDKKQEVKRVLIFYRKCLEIYNQRKLRNQQSKSMKMLFNHLSLYFYPKIGCIANKLEQKQYLISSSPEINQHTIQQHHFLHEILDFVRQIYYYCQDQMSQTLLEEQIVSFYLKYSFINFIKLYSFITVNELINLQSEHIELTTKESPHVSYHPSINTIYMIDFIKIITSISINRNQQISKKIKQYRILQFFIREFELEFQVAENVQKFMKKVIKIVEVPPKPKAPSSDKNKNQPIPPLNFKSQKPKQPKQSSPIKQRQKGDSKPKKYGVVPSLKLPVRSDRSQSKQGKGVLDNLLSQINQKPKKPNLQLNLQLTKLNLQKNSQRNHIAKSSERNLIYSSQRKIRKIYSNKTLHSQAILLVISLLLNKGLLDPEYCDQFPITHGKINALYILHHHLNQESNVSVIPILAQAVSKIKPYLSGQRLLKLLSTKFTDLNHYKDWKKISAGAYGVIYGCQTNIEEPRQVAIKEMSFPKSVYQRCVLHDIFTEISCLQNFRLDERITTMYNYGVVNNAYIIVMKKYDCSLRDWVLKHKDKLPSKFKQILKIFWQILNIILLLHQKSVTHYDIKADNILLMVDQSTQDPVKVVLGDFGECRIYDQLKQQLDMKSRGTQCIKSPEMLTLALHLKKQADNYDRRKKIGTTRASDIWSLGCLFYQLLTGQYLYHRADWVNFYIQVTSQSQDILLKANLSKLQQFARYNQIHELLKVILVRDPQHRPQIKGLIQKFKDLFKNQIEQNPPPVKSPLVIQKDLEVLVSKYVQEIKKNQTKLKPQKTNSQQNLFLKCRDSKDKKIRGMKFINSYNQSKNNKFMRIMQDIFFCDNISLLDGGYQKIKQLKITHIVTTLKHPLLQKFNTLFISFNNINLPNIAFRLAPKISDLLRQVLLLKGRLLFINDQSNYGTNLLIYTLSYWFRCSVYETWCLINTQILLFPTFTSDLSSLSSALRLLNQVQECVEQLPKLQCICGSVTLILKDFSKIKKKGDLSCKCKKKKLNQFSNMANGPQCVNIGCQQYLQFVKKRYSISWESIKWSVLSTSNLLTTVFNTGKTKDIFKTQIILNSAQPYQNMIQTGSCIKTCKVFSCRLCQMMILATNENKDQLLIVMNNMLRRIRQGIMIPNAQESFAKKTPALTYYTLTKLHMTKGPEQ